MHAVDVAGRREAADVAGVVGAPPDQVQVGVEQLLVLDALDDAERAPRDVVVDARELAGTPDEPDGSFSIVALVWRPGQFTRIHDHVTWCTFGVIQGVEHEELFDADLNLIGRSANHVGDVSGFAPPGDIHRVHNTGAGTAVSLHVYGADLGGADPSSVRRVYDLPVR